MKTLDGVDRALDPEMLMITDTAGSIAVAGVMGGAETEVSAGTTSILLEVGQLQLPEHPAHEPDAQACGARRRAGSASASTRS